jgi:two-component system, NtrC family, response regulator GlrR
MPRILLVDDDASVRRVVRLTFERAGFTVTEAESAFRALDLLKTEQLDAVVSDVFMPGMNGLVFYRHLMERMPSLRNRVVFLTGANRDPDVHRPIEQLGVPMLGKLDNLKLVIDAVSVALLRPLEPENP